MIVVDASGEPVACLKDQGNPSGFAFVTNSEVGLHAGTFFRQEIVLDPATLPGRGPKAIALADLGPIVPLRFATFAIPDADRKNYALKGILETTDSLRARAAAIISVAVPLVPNAGPSLAALA